jgi:YidC/Oxa1 family membrane protein insertase
MQSRLMTPPSTGDQQSSMMMGMMNIYMPFLMGWLALTLASGLSLYFVTSNLIGIAQYAILGRLNWANLIPGRKAVSPAPTKKTPVIEKAVSEPAPEAKSRPVLTAKNNKEPVKATKTVKATKPVSKPTKMNPKPKP